MAWGIDLGLQLGLGGSAFAIHGSGRRTSPASGVPEARAGPRPRHLGHKLRGGSVMLTRGLWWPGLRWKEEDDNDRRRRGVGLSRRKVMPRWPGSLACVDRLRGLLWR
jgi:hypothetical protein